MFAQIKITDQTVVGVPGPLPANLVGLSDAALADLSAAINPPPLGLDGQGFWPVVMSTPSFDATAQILDGTVTLGTPDLVSHTVAATANVRALTDDEIAERLAATRAAMPDISDRQCFQALANLGKITEDEAVAAVSTGQMPKIVTDGIAQLPADQQFPARMLLCGATTFHRAHPMVEVFGSFFGMGDTDLDVLWRAAVLL